MKWFQRATDKTYRKAIEDEASEGRLPIARFTWGSISGHGWGFLRPWEQKALFPAKGTPLGFGDPNRDHEPFWILRLQPVLDSFKHPNQDYYIQGRYWYGLVWRRSFGPWYKPWRAKEKLLDPDEVYDDPGKADDWGDRPGEDWG